MIARAEEKNQTQELVIHNWTNHNAVLVRQWLSFTMDDLMPCNPDITKLRTVLDATKNHVLSIPYVNNPRHTSPEIKEYLGCLMEKFRTYVEAQLGKHKVDSLYSTSLHNMKKDEARNLIVEFYGVYLVQARIREFGWDSEWVRLLWDEWRNRVSTNLLAKEYYESYCKSRFLGIDMRLARSGSVTSLIHRICASFISVVSSMTGTQTILSFDRKSVAIRNWDRKEENKVGSRDGVSPTAIVNEGDMVPPSPQIQAQIRARLEPVIQREKHEQEKRQLEQQTVRLSGSQESPEVIHIVDTGGDGNDGGGSGGGGEASSRKRKHRSDRSAELPPKKRFRIDKYEYLVDSIFGRCENEDMLSSVYSAITRILSGNYSRTFDRIECESSNDALVYRDFAGAWSRVVRVTSEQYARRLRSIVDGGGGCAPIGGTGETDRFDKVVIN